MKLNIGSIMSGPQLIFRGITNWLVGLDRGKLLASEDGLRFSWIPFKYFYGSNINIVKNFDDEFWIGGEQGKVAKSTNGINWTTINTGFDTNIVSIKYGPKKNNNSFSLAKLDMDFGTGGGAATTTRDIVYGNGRWFAALNNASRISTDMITWIAGRTKDINEVYNLTYINNKFYYSSLRSSMFESTDAVFWTTIARFESTIDKFAYGNNIWVAAISTTVRTSTDLITWVTRPIPASLLSLTYGNGIWVGGGINRIIITSTDTITWTSRTSYFLTNSNVNHISYGNGMFIASASNTAGLRNSTNGISWTTIPNTLWISGVIDLNYKNFLWTGINSINIITSTDAISWSSINTNAVIDSSLTLYAMSCNDEKCLIGTNKPYLLVYSNTPDLNSYAVGAE